MKNDYLEADNRKFHIPTIQDALKKGVLSRGHPEKHPALPAFLEWEKRQPKPAKRGRK